MSTHKEVESKILDVNFEEIFKKSQEIWGKLEFLKQEFISVRVKNILGIKFRIRKEWEYTMIEHKEKLWSRNWVKIANETSMKVLSFEEAREFAKKIWFNEISYSVKERTQFLLNLEDKWKWNAIIILDEYSNLEWIRIPTLLEIEAINKNVILEVSHLLWFNEKDLKAWWTKKVSQHYKSLQTKITT